MYGRHVQHRCERRARGGERVYDRVEQLAIASCFVQFFHASLLLVPLRCHPLLAFFCISYDHRSHRSKSTTSNRSKQKK